jgi:hypothetical protein
MRVFAVLALLAALPQDPPRLTDRWVAAFYRAAWNAETGEGMTRAGGGDALQDHPDSFTDFGYHQVSWHRRNLEEMGEAGIEVALCEFAGHEPAVKALVQALEDSTKERKRIPRVAPAAVDPAVVPSFLAAVPSVHLAAVGDRKLVWLRPSEKAKPFEDPGMFVVGDAAWKPHIAVRHGGAFDGPREGEAVTLGPGFQDGSARFRARAEGAWYEKCWYAALKIRPRIVAIESWNRFDEGSTVCPTKEQGRSWIEKTRKYAEQFDRGQEIARPKGKYSATPGVSYHLKFDPPNEGLRPVEMAAAPFEVVNLAGQTFLMSKAVKGQELRILAFDIDESYAWYERREFEVQAQVLDKGRGQIDLEYDAATPGKGGGDRTRRVSPEPYYYTDSGGWATATWRLPDAVFANRQEGGSDFRLVTKGRGLSLRWIQLRAK